MEADGKAQIGATSNKHTSHGPHLITKLYLKDDNCTMMNEYVLFLIGFISII